MKKGIWLGFGILGIALLAGCDPAPEETKKENTPSDHTTPPTAMPTFVTTPVSVDWQTYSDDDLHFSFESPVHLEVHKSIKGLPNPTVEMEGNEMYMNISIHMNAQDVGKLAVDLNAEFDKKVDFLKSMSPTLRNLQVAANPVTLSDAAGFLAEGTASLPGKFPYAVKMLLVRKDAVILNMLIQYSPTEEYKAQAERVLNSLSFTR